MSRDTGLRPACLCLVVLGCAGLSGCGRSEHAAVTVSAQRIHPVLLLSELRDAADPQELLETGFDFKNASSAPAQLRFDGAGCSCYGVTNADRTLTKGDLLTIPAGGDLRVDIEVPTPTSAGEREFTARFSWLPQDEEPVSLPISLSMPVQADLWVSPGVLTYGYRPQQSPKSQTIRVQCHSRDREAVESPPQLEQLHAFLKPGAWRLVTLKQPTAGLWQAVWDVELAVDLPDDYREQVSTTLQIRSGERETFRMSVLIQPQVGIRSPGEVQFGLLKLGEPRRRRVLLASSDQVEFRVLEATSLDPRCRVSVDADVPAGRHWLEIEAELSAAEDLDTRIVCRTDHPEAAEVTMAVRAKPEQPIAAAEDAP